MHSAFAQVEVLLRGKRYQDAKARLRQILAADPDNARAHALLSYVLYLQGRNADALHESESAIGLDPNDPEPHYFSALALLALDRAASAMSAIQEAIRLAPETARYHALVSRIHVKRKAWHWFLFFPPQLDRPSALCACPAF